MHLRPGSHVNGNCQFGRTDSNRDRDLQEREQVDRKRDPQRRCGCNYSIHSPCRHLDDHGKVWWRLGARKKHVTASGAGRESGDFDNDRRVFAESFQGGTKGDVLGQGELANHHTDWNGEIHGRRH